MFRLLTVQKVVILNLTIAASFFLLNNSAYVVSINIFCCGFNVSFIIASLYNLRKKVKPNYASLFIGRKRTLILIASIGFFTIHLFALFNVLISQYLIILDLIWSSVISITHVFENEFSVFLNKILKKGKRIVVVGNSETSLQIASKLEKGRNHFFHGRLDFDVDEFLKNTSLSPYIDFAKKHQVREFYWSVPAANAGQINTIVEEAEKHCIKVNFIANGETETLGYSIHYVNDMPFLKKYKEPLVRLRNQAVKKTFDIILSTFVILFILSWLIPLIGLIIKLESKGPVFFKQQRSGTNNKPFVCLKFRTMKVNEHSNSKQTAKNDMRITGFGKFLRKTSIDELPQFINVLKGEMSIVGPRPHMLQHTEEYNKQVSNYMARLYLKPGVTGWAQANGYRGEIREIEFMRKRVEHDIWYMENWSLLLDVKILWMTFISILKGDVNAY